AGVCDSLWKFALAARKETIALQRPIAAGGIGVGATARLHRDGGRRLHRLHREISGRLYHDCPLATDPGDNGRPVFGIMAPARLASHSSALSGNVRISTWGSVNDRKPRSCNNPLPAGSGEGVASAMRRSWVRPPSVSLRKRIVRRAFTSRTFLTV